MRFEMRRWDDWLNQDMLIDTLFHDHNDNSRLTAISRSSIHIRHLTLLSVFLD